MAEGSAKDSQSKIMIFRPTLDEFEDFAGYVGYMEKQGAHNYGIAKVNIGRHVYTIAAITYVSRNVFTPVLWRT